MPIIGRGCNERESNKQCRIAILYALILAALCASTAHLVLRNSSSSSQSTSSKVHLMNKRGKTTKRAILLSSQDTGSTWLNSVLNGMDNVSFRGERMINYSYKSYDEWRQVDWKKYKMQLETALESQVSDGLALVGFKLMYDQLPQQLHVQFAQWLNDNEISVIHLRRKAAILQMASHRQKVHAKSSGAMKHDHVTSAKAVVEYPKIEFDSTIDAERIRQLETNQRDFADYLHVHAPMAPQMDLWYEHLDGPHKTRWFNALFAFLDLELRMTDQDTSDLVKVGKRKCDDRIEGIHGPDYGELAGLESQMACAMLYWQSETEAKQGHSQSFYPPEQDKCRLTPAMSGKCIDSTYKGNGPPRHRSHD